MKTHLDAAKTNDSKQLEHGENTLQAKSATPPAFNLTAGAVQKKDSGDAGAEGGEALIGDGAGKVKGGSAAGLPPNVQAKMESSMGADFSGVKIHQNSGQATQLGALAFTQGNEMHFAPGQFNPQSQGGQELIGHELAHVVQQRAGRVQPTADHGGVPVNDNAGLELEADEMGAKAARGQSAGAASAGAAGGGGGVQMKAAIQMKKADPNKRWDSGTFFKEYSDKVDKSGLNKVETEYFKNYAAGADIYLARPNQKWTGVTDMTGQMFADGAMRAYLKYEKDVTKIIPLDFALAQSQHETHFNAKPRVSSTSKKNPMNVGEYDNSTASWVKDIKSTEQGVSMYYDLMAEDYLSNQSPDELRKSMKNEVGSKYATGEYIDYMGTQPDFIKKYIIGKGGVWPSMEGNTASSPAPEKGLDLGKLAEVVYNAMNGAGTDEEAVYGALAQLNHDATLIGNFKKIYQSTYGTDVVDDIKGDFSNTMVFGDELEKALGYLNLSSQAKAPAKSTPKAADAASTRKDEKMGRVEMLSSKDNSFTASRWEHADGTPTKYAEAYDTKLAIELKAEFGKEITQAQVLKMIEDAKATGDTKKAEEYRKKLFIANQYAVVEALNVDQTTADGTISGKNAMGRDFRSTSNHEMYGKTQYWDEKKQKWMKQTYCNVYAYDVVTAMGGYIPRVWWMADYEKKAIEAMNLGKPYEEKVEYGKTVEEVNANALNGWFDRIGSYYGWKQAASMEEAQKSANDGNIVVISAANKESTSSGHVSVILAERGTHVSTKVDGKTDVPLTSQAGGTNQKYGTNGKWWENSDHKNGHAWIYTAKPDSPLMKPEEIGMSGTVGASTEKTTTTEKPTTAEKPSTGTKTTPTNKPVTPTTKTNPSTPGKPIASGEVTASELTVRKGPAKTFESVGHNLKQGEKVSIYEEKDGWMRVGEGQWVSGTYVKKTASAPTKPGMDFTALATRVYDAMDGAGTVEQTVYSTLALLKHDDQLISQFMAAYQAKYKHSVVDDIKGDFSNTYLFGDELDMALSYLNMGPKKVTGGNPAVKPKDPTTTAPASDRTPVIIKGSVGEKCDNAKDDVTAIQGLLAKLGLGTVVNGTCDKPTKSAIYIFQQAYGLGVDGQIGATGETLKKMNATATGAFSNSKAAMDKDPDAPKFDHANFTNKQHLLESTGGMTLPKQFYGNMKTLIKNLNALGDAFTKNLHVNCGFRSPNFNATLEGSATASNHQWGEAADISSPNYTSVQLRDKVLELIKEGKMQDGGLGIYGSFIHYDVGGAGRRWDKR